MVIQKNNALDVNNVGIGYYELLDIINNFVCYHQTFTKNLNY